MGWFDKAEEGSLTTRLAADTYLIQEGISDKAGLVVQYTAQFIAGFVIAFVKGWKLALVLLAAIPALGIVGSVMIKIMSSYTTKGQDAYAEAGAVAEQVFAGIRTVYSFSLQQRFRDRYEKKLEVAYKAGVHKGFALGWGFGSFMLVLFSTYGLAFWYGSRLVLDGTMNGGEVLNVFFALMIGAMSLMQIPTNIAAFASASGAAYKIFNTIDRVPEIDASSTEGLKPDKVRGHIVFKNVQFNYPSRPDVKILKQLDLEIQPGTTVAIVGPSGSGKSTTVQLIQRFYDPAEGEVLLDGNNLKDVNVKWLRQQIGIVSQEPVLFNTMFLLATGIKNNLIMGSLNSTVTEEQIIDACKQANCHHFIIQLPKGYDTVVGEHGGMLSGGQKQRIAIARALIKGPAILLLDEATSALDTASERLVQRALDTVSKNRSTVVIAHRLSTIKHANLIVVMDQGVVAEKGTHDELYALGGIYYELVNKQKLKTKEGETEQGGRSIPIVDDESVDDEEIERALQEETIQISQQVVDETDKVVETKITLDEDTQSEDSGTRKRRLEKEDEKLKMQQKAPIKRVLMMMKPDWPIMFIGTIGAAVAGAIFPMFALVFSHILGILYRPSEIDPGPFQGANLWAFTFVLIGVGGLFSIGAQSSSFELAGERLTRRIRIACFKALLNQEIGFYDEEEHSLGALTTRLATDASKIHELVTKVFGDLIQVTVTGIVGLVIALVGSWQLTLVVLACAPFIMAASAFDMRMHHGFNDKTKKAYEESGQIAGEAIKEIRTVASLNREQYFEEKFAENIIRPHKLAVRKAWLSSFGYGLSQGFMLYANAVAFYAGLRFAILGILNTTELFQVLFAIMMTASGLGRGSTFLSRWVKAKIAAINVFELIDRQTAIDPNAPGSEIPAIEGKVSLSDIAFTYPARPDAPIFTGGLNIEALPRKTVAIVGPSGCGKSTVIGMLERWYDANAGTVSIENLDVKRWQLNFMRKHLALVGQEPVLFDLTIKENILYGTDREDVTEEELEEVAKSANIYDFVKDLPVGKDAFDTRVGDKGSQLSGGQKQRIAIARALIRQPKILLLDEATSALDSESEKLVQEALDKAVEGRTTITIAHRLSTIQNADLIVVVKDGVVAEQGTHFELIELGGIYKDLVTQQDLNALM
ncbi:hypothetical protein BC938DRAFT_480878 [Jimgerdemannia flammicorona]|uniref:P-loop containing nucleoside triphosphate hydrolase protein n=1 Tax=Jimgerdemannia flammicorona TaxID=994334 RepID=A0A433QHL2_9FUNG|nr:hypothetical protein BC938DRAFT_480878 [Jimgerdemannia flammicorona]